MDDPLTELARQFAAGQLGREEFLRASDDLRSAVSTHGTLDLERQLRCGFAEVVYGEGKTVVQIERLIEGLCAADQAVLVTRLDEQKGHSLAERFPTATYNPLARTLRMTNGDGERQPPVEPGEAVAETAVICAGTSDLPVAEEARETLRWMGFPPYFACDVGVAGPHRLLPHLEAIRRAVAVVVVAGMEGALPSVVGGHVSAPVIAVPTSVGYGAALGGIAALLGMLNSCAANVCVTNIDAGFKGAYMAGLIARQAVIARERSGAAE